MLGRKLGFDKGKRLEGLLGNIFDQMVIDEYNYVYTDAMVIRIDAYVIVRRSDLHGNWGYISGKGIEIYFDEHKSDEKIFKYIEQIKLLM